MSHLEIIQICQQLSKEGKQPSVALIKARLIKKQPLPNIIAGFKQWQANPNQTIENKQVEPKANSTLSLEQKVDALQNEVQELKAELGQLKGMIKS